METTTREEPVGETVRALTDAYSDARIALEEAMDAEKAARENFDGIEARLFDALENAGLRQVRTARGLYTLNDLAWSVVTDEEAARVWAEAERPELITLNRQRLAVIVREALKADAPMPPGVGFTTSRKVNWRRQ